MDIATPGSLAGAVVISIAAWHDRALSVTGQVYGDS
jgi:hypothetical protein